VLRASGGPSILRELSDEQIAVSMEDAARINACAVAVQVFIGGEFETQSVRNLTRLVDESQRYGIPVLAVTAVMKAGQLMATVQENTYQQAVNNAQSQLAAAQAVYVLDEKNYDRYSSLYKNNVVAKANYDSSLQSYQSSLSGVQAKQATLNNAQINLGYCKLTSPMDGVILSRNIEVGSLVGSNITAFQIADTRSMKAVFAIPDVVVSQLKTGSPLTVTTEALPGIGFGGTITRISPNADQTTRVFDVEVTIPNDRRQLRTGNDRIP
jgi:RND family efflux transporter MFP subunit